MKSKVFWIVLLVVVAILFFLSGARYGYEKAIRDARLVKMTDNGYYIEYADGCHKYN